MKIAVIVATLFLRAFANAQAPGTETPVIRVGEIRFADVTQLDGRDLERCAARLEAQSYTGERWLEEVAEGARVGCWQAKGYYRAEVKAEESTRGAHGVVLTVREGPQYRLGVITISGNRVVASDLLVSAVPLRPGEVFDSDKIKEGVDNLRKAGKYILDTHVMCGKYILPRKAYADIGYLDFNSQVTTEVDDERQIIEISWGLREGRPFFIRTVQFDGVSAAMEDTLRQRLLLKSGSVYSRQLMEKSLDKMRKMLPPRTGLDDELRYDRDLGVVDVSIKRSDSGQQ